MRTFLSTLLVALALAIGTEAAEQIKISALPRTNSLGAGDLILVAQITGGTSNTLAITKSNLLAGISSGLNFNSSQFAIINGTNVMILDGAGFTNMLVQGSLSSPGPIYSGGLVVTNGLTNLVLTASRALVSDANKGIVSSSVTATELGYLSGVTSALQTQIAGFVSTAQLNSASNVLQIATSNNVAVAAGSGISVATAGAGGRQTYTVTATGGGGASNVIDNLNGTGTNTSLYGITTIANLADNTNIVKVYVGGALNISNALVSVQNNQTVLIGPGNYDNHKAYVVHQVGGYTTFKLFNLTNVHVRGYGAGTRIGFTNYGDCFFVSNCNNVTISDMGIFGKPPIATGIDFNLTNLHAVITVEGSTNCTFERLFIKDHGDQGIFCYQQAGARKSYNCTVRDNVFVNLGSWGYGDIRYDGAAVVPGSGWTVERNETYDCARGVEPFATYGLHEACRIINNKFFNCLDEAIAFGGQATSGPEYGYWTGGEISGNYIEYTPGHTRLGSNAMAAFAISVHNASNVVVRGNTVKGAPNDGIVARIAGASNMTHILIEGNFVSRARVKGIDLSADTANKTINNSTIRGNIITDNGRQAIQFSGTNNIVEHNVIHNWCLSNPGGVGVDPAIICAVGNGNSNSIIRFNTIYDDQVVRSGGIGIRLDNGIKQVRVAGNICYGQLGADIADNSGTEAIYHDFAFTKNGTNLTGGGSSGSDTNLMTGTNTVAYLLASGWNFPGVLLGHQAIYANYLSSSNKVFAGNMSVGTYYGDSTYAAFNHTNQDNTSYNIQLGPDGGIYLNSPGSTDFSLRKNAIDIAKITTNGMTIAGTNNSGHLNVTNSVLLSARTASKILRTDASKIIGEVTVGANLSFDGTTLSATGGGGGSGSADITLNGDVSIGATTVAVTGTLPAGYNSRALLFQVDPCTTNCETIGVNSLSGSTFTVGRAFRLAHTNGSKVLIKLDGNISPVDYGARGDGATDDWQALQRAIVEAQEVGGCVVGGLDLDGRSFSFKQPLYFAEFRARELRLITPIDFTVIQTGETNVAAALKTARNSTTFTAYASTNAILFTGTESFATVGHTIAFNNPYGETLPGGIVSGRLYKIKTSTHPSSGSMTLSEITSSTELDITSNGTGWLWPNHNSLTRVKWDKVRLTIGTTNLNGVFLCVQQQCFTRELRVDMAYPGTNSIGVNITGQGSVHYNLEVDPYSPLDNVNTSNQIAIRLEGVFQKLTGFTTVNGKGRCAVQVTGRNHKIDALLTEQLKLRGVEILDGCQDLVIEQIYNSAPDTNTPAIEDLSGANSSYTVGSIINGSSDVMMFRDLTRGYTISGWDGSALSGLGDTDNNNVYPGHVQLQGYTCPQITGRRELAAVNDSRALRHIDKSVHVDSGAASRIITLSRAGGWRGLNQRVIKIASANSVIVTNLSGETINGSTAGITLTNIGACAEFVSDGISDWRQLTFTP